MQTQYLLQLEILNPGWRKGSSLAVLGFPVRHSLSPFMHNAALQQMAAVDSGFADWRYFALELSADKLAQALPVLHAAGFVGLNLTIPHKVEVLPLLEEVDPSAARMGAVNTLVRTPTGYAGFNTDGYGIKKALEEALGCFIEKREVLLLGAGGAARAIAVQCLESGCSRLTVVNRSAARLSELEARLSTICSSVPRRYYSPDIGDVDWENAPIVINATSLGLKAEDPVPLSAVALPAGSVIYDTTYGCRNQLALEAEQRGLPYADGLSMLVWQGVRSLEIWSKAPVPADIMQAAVESELERRKAIC